MWFFIHYNIEKLAMVVLIILIRTIVINYQYIILYNNCLFYTVLMVTLLYNCIETRQDNNYYYVNIHAYNILKTGDIL